MEFENSTDQSTQRDSNPRPVAYKATALTAELCVVTGSTGMGSGRVRDLRGSLTSLYKQRVSPQRPTGAQDVQSCVHVSIENEPADRTAVCAHLQRLVDGGAALAAQFTCVARIHFHDFASSLFRFDVQPVKEVSPRNIVNRFCKWSSGKTTDRQALYEDYAVRCDERSRDTEMVFSTKIRDTSMLTCENASRSCSSFASFFSSHNSSLSTFGFYPRVFEYARVFEDFSVTRCSERGESEIDSDIVPRLLSRSGRNVDAEKRDVPAPALVSDAQTLRRAADRSVQFQLDLADDRQSNAFAASYDERRCFAASTIQPTEIVYEQRCETLATLEARVAGDLSGFHATKEVLERFVEAAERAAQDDSRNCSDVGSCFSNSRQLAKLHELGEPDTLFSPGITSFLQPGVVQFACPFQPLEQDAFLSARRVQPVAEGANHDLLVAQGYLYRQAEAFS